MIKALQLAALGAVLTMLTCIPAQAATFAFQYTGPNLPPSQSGSGQFTAVASGSDYLITGITGTIDGNAITQLIAPGGFAGNDNKLFSTGPAFDFAGVSFAVGSTNYNLYQDNGTFVGSGYALCTQCSGGNEESLSTFTISAVPEPEVWAMMLLGAGMIGGGLRIARRQNGKALIAA